MSQVHSSNDGQGHRRHRSGPVKVLDALRDLDQLASVEVSAYPAGVGGGQGPQPKGGPPG